MYRQEKLGKEINMPSKKVCFVLNNAPDYREGFLTSLSNKYELSVIAEKNSISGLSDPVHRLGYSYREYMPFLFMGFRLAPLGLLRYLKNMDAVILAYNPRNIVFLILSVLLKRFFKFRLIWWGQINGRNTSILIEKMRLYLLSKGDYILVYNEDIRISLSAKVSIPIVSFNNSHVNQNDIHPLKNKIDSTLNLLFVGRNQPRKKLERLILIAKKNAFVRIRVVGPNMVEFKEILLNSGLGNIEVFGKTDSESLKDHMTWANACINPGHAGLFVMTSAQFGLPLIVDSSSEHAPEIILAREAKQYFVDFTDEESVNILLREIKGGERNIQEDGLRFARLLKESYTIENMVSKHLDVLREIT